MKDKTSKKMKKTVDISIKSKLFILNLLPANLKEIFVLGKQKLDSIHHQETKVLNVKEHKKSPLRFEVINLLLEKLNRKTTYLEIGVNDLAGNFNRIKADEKYSIDPGYEVGVDKNQADFKMTSDEFFEQLEKGEILNKEILFDVIFIDGLHLAVQVDKDLENAFRYLKDDGFIVMHDCNPPTEFHASESHSYRLSPADEFWNGTTWKAFFKLRKRTDVSSCCIDSDWGIGIVSKTLHLGKPSSVKNEFYDFQVLSDNRKESLNLISFEQLKSLL